MKLWLRFLLGAAAALAAMSSAQAQASLSATSVAGSPASVKPGDSVNITIGITNGGATTPGADFAAGGTVNFSVQFTHITTGYQFTRTGTATAAAAIAGAGGSGTVTGSITVPTQTTEAGAYSARVTISAPSGGAGVGTATFNNSGTVLTVTGTPDFQITNLTYGASTSYVGGNVIPMTVTYRNRSSSNGQPNVPWVASAGGTGATYYRIQVILSSNPVYGDADDFRLTLHDRSAKLDANDADQVISWNQLLPGNFSGSYYVLAKIDALDATTETIENDLTQNGNNIWQDVAATRIALQPSTFPTIYLASTTGSSGTNPSGNGYSDNPSLTADGRYTAYASDASNLVSGDTNGVRDIFLFDSQTSLVRRLNLSQQGAQGNANSNTPALSGNGRYVAFSSDATNLIVGDVNGFADIFVVDTLTGAISLQSVSTAGAQANGSSFRPSVSHTGRYIVFESSATNLAGATTPGVTHIYLRDRDVSGSGTFDTAGNTSTVLIDVNGATAGNASAVQAQISADGNFVVFASRATNLAGAATTANRQHIYVRDRAGATTTRVSVGLAAAEPDADSRTPSINRNTGVAAGNAADGLWITYGSDATNLVAGDTNAVSDIFVVNRVSLATVRASVSAAGAQANDPTVVTVTGSRLGSLNPSISATGRFVTFASLADNLTAGDTVGQHVPGGSGNGALNIYVMDRDLSASGTYDTGGNLQVSNVSVNRFGYQSIRVLGVQSTAAADIFPVISADGRWVAFPFDAEGSSGLIHTTTNLISQDNNTARDVVLFDRRTNSLPNPNTLPVVTITSPGTGGTALVNTTISVRASATTTIGVVSSVQFFVNGTSLGTSTVFPYSASWTPTAVGNYTLSALVTDNFGNIGVSSNVVVTINAAPSVGITSPVAGSSITAGVAQTITATAAASNPGATITSVQFLVNGAAQGAADTTAPYSVAWTPAAAGSYTLTAVATDSVGTQTTSPAVSVTVTAAGGGGGSAPTPPTVSVTAPSTATVNTAQFVSATAAATGGSIASVQFFANGTTIGTVSAFPYSILWTPVSTGTYAITATATDNLGTQATSTAWTVTVTSGTAPTVSIVNPSSGTSVPVGTTQTIVANASAGVGALARVEFYANGALLGSDTIFPYNQSWTPNGTGSVSLVAVAVDNAGNRTTSGAVAVTVSAVSATAPTVAVTAPAAGASIPIGSATNLSATAADADGTIVSVQFFANGVAVGAADTAFPYNASFLPLSPGNYAITAQAIDNGGNIATSAPVTVSVAGGAAPSVAVTAPVAGTTVAVNTSQTLTATASSPTAVISSVQFLVNGIAVGAADTTFPYSAVWTPASLGTYSITARATDSVGNISDSAPIVVTAGSSAAPTVAMVNPADGSAYTVGTAVTLNASAQDSDGTIAGVQFLINGVLQGAPDTTAPYAAAFTPTSVGVYTVAAQATDNTGNVATSAPITITIGANAAPTISLTSPSSGLSFGLGNQVLLAATAVDADGTVASVQFFANGLLLGTASSAPYNVSWRPTVAGAFSVTATAIDNVGNATTSAPVAVTITSVAAPSVAITNPVAGTPYGVGNAIPVVATTSGGNGPIAQVQFFVNGAPLGAADTSSPYTGTWTPNAPGLYTVLAVATDSAGISSNSTPLNVTIAGNAPPLVALTSPPSGTIVNGGSVVSLTASASDADGTITAVRFLANGNVVATATAAPYIGAWTPTAAGSYTVVAQAQDNSGNVTNSPPVTVVVAANQAPRVAITGPGNGSAVRLGGSTTISASASDTDGTIASVQFFANGVAVGAADTSSPYTATWTANSEGIYRLTAVALDNSGAATTSAVATVLVVAAGAGDAIYSGNYAGLGETGTFAAVVVRGRTAAFVAYSGAAPTRTYFYPGLSVDAGGGFASFDSLGRSLVAGTATETGISGTLDAGRLTFIGVASFTAGTATVPAGYYNGNIANRPDSVFAAIVAPDGKITVYAQDGTFRDAGNGSVSANGSFSVTTLAGNRFTGTADPATGFIRGNLTGGPGGALVAALTSGVSFSDGFLRNLSTRGQVGTGSNILIAGFVVGGDVPKQVLVRAVGPSLTQFGVTGALADTQLQLFQGTSLLQTNDNWGGAAAISTAANQVGAFAFNPTSLDSAILATLPPGAYTAQVSGVGGRTGVALVELYDVDNQTPFSTQKVMNVATRGVVGAGQAQLIAGFVVSGNTAKKVLIRGVGPSLASVGVTSGFLADPLLTLVRGENVMVRENDNWETGNDAALITDASTRVGAFPLVAGARDAAILINLPPGTYSAQVSAPGAATGVALIEVYEVP